MLRMQNALSAEKDKVPAYAQRYKGVKRGSACRVLMWSRYACSAERHIAQIRIIARIRI
jgi:hypothetical protein